MAVVVSALGPRASELSESYSYADYCKDNREKASEAGRAVFQAKLKEVLAHNRNNRNNRNTAAAVPKPNSNSWKKGLNAFSHRAAPGPSKGRVAPPEAWLRERTAAHRRPAPVEALARAAAGGLPASVDWSAYDTPVKEQGGCGACWAFASTQLVESYLAIGTGLRADLSAQQLVACGSNDDDCGGFGGCSGSVPELAFSYLAANTNASGGLLTEWQLGYSSYFGMGNGTQTFVFNDDALDAPLMNVSTCGYVVPALQQSGAGLLVGVEGFVKLPQNDASAVMAALATVGPLAVNVDASDWADYESGVFSGCSYDDMDIDHVVVLVGYGTDEESGEDYWLVRNSWGVTWGERGYIRLKRDPVDDTPCGVDDTPQDGTGCFADRNTPQKPCGQCGVVFDASYPTGVTAV